VGHDRWTPAELAAWQRERLAELVGRARAGSAFYRRLYADVDLASLVGERDDAGKFKLVESCRPGSAGPDERAGTPARPAGTGAAPTP